MYAAAAIARKIAPARRRAVTPEESMLLEMSPATVDMAVMLIVAMRGKVDLSWRGENLYCNVLLLLLLLLLLAAGCSAASAGSVFQVQS
jgi:hypothetical protein